MGLRGVWLSPIGIVGHVLGLRRPQPTFEAQNFSPTTRLEMATPEIQVGPEHVSYVPAGQFTLRTGVVGNSQLICDGPAPA